MSLSRWDAPNGSYTSSIPPGMVAFRKVVAELYGFTRTEVVRDRSRCARTRSEHCECGACDFFTSDLSPTGKGRRLFDDLIPLADRLGVQSIIFNRRVVGFGNPDERLYQGPSPHTDHVHVGLNRWARRSLTEKMVRDALGGGGGGFLSDLTKEQQKEVYDGAHKVLLNAGGKELDQYIKTWFEAIVARLDVLETKIDALSDGT